ncbi:SET domain-containing protein SmydA-8-like [Harmonia axyridis]|uniref:SET domain-containing protein SmydA-8-like n=1 Tax=Harmonia axyridis TaxID=115357 RepID=UPI001E2777B1|nr:SET domain-containing protein SmydA-8-like [Harmonia axyridis]XP_045477346.1 SET domain-containing protein SmydA-8-like [Harmonia axyridis]XP_045477347.1 SET domain-containing protein SmydA-8-like [Harmonia axyridis]XP_045477348.1 SET domain-containing protein SmydA-8-like [Harmonia axyridis]
MMSENLCAVCNNPGEKKCPSCKVIHYCSLEHQKQHWDEHKNNCFCYEVQSSDVFGKHLIARRDLERGEVIFSEVPLLFGPKPTPIDNGPFPCVGCSQLLNQETSDKCEACLWPCCSKKCPGLGDNLRHGLECKILRLSKGGLNSNESFYKKFRFDILIVLRTLLLQKVDKEKWDELMDLEAYLGKRGQGTKIHRIVDEKVKYLQENYLNPLKSYEQETKNNIIPMVDTKTLHKIYGILDVHSTELNGQMNAALLYLKSSVIEHNCTPNTMQAIENADNKYRIIVRASTNIKKGEKITTMYTHILWGTTARRRNLWQKKYLQCFCDRCKDPTEFGTYFNALKCMGTEKEPCGGSQLPSNPTDLNSVWNCDKCKISLPNDDVMEFVNHLGNEVDKVLAKDAGVKDLEDILKKLLVFLHPNHYHVYTVKHSLVQLYARSEGDVSDEEFTKKFEMCQDLIGITKKLDPGNARLSIYLAVLQNELFLGKFSLLQKRFNKESKDVFKEEVDAMRKMLEEASDALKYEIGSLTGQKMNEVICLNKVKFIGWMKENGMVDL